MYMKAPHRCPYCGSSGHAAEFMCPPKRRRLLAKWEHPYTKAFQEQADQAETDTIVRYLWAETTGCHLDDSENALD